jgi:hypothetical protein
MENAQEYPHGLRVMADYFSSDLWAICLPGEAGPFRHQMISHEKVGLPQALADRFDWWIADYGKHLDDPENFDFAGFNAEGRAIATALKQHVGARCTVLYASAIKANGQYGGCGPDEEIL